MLSFIVLFGNFYVKAYMEKVKITLLFVEIRSHQFSLLGEAGVLRNGHGLRSGQHLLPREEEEAGAERHGRLFAAERREEA